MNSKKAYFAGGCFWGFEELFRKEKWVTDTQVWYMGGENENPSYQNHPGHAEAIEISYNSDEVSFQQLLDFFFRIHNPTTLNQQWNDRGSSYRSAIFYQNNEELKQANDFIKIVDASGRWTNCVSTTLEKYAPFWEAEDEHQDYLKNNPNGYTCHYIHWGSYV